MDSIYIFKYHVVADEVKGTGEGFVFAADFDAAYGELKKMYGSSYITKIVMEKVGEPDCYVFETKADGKEVTDRWYC